ncbi:MAG: hypothetical protein ACOC04_03235 [Halothece sp.]
MSKPPLEELVAEVNAINHAWKVAGELEGESSPLATSLRDLKRRLQVRLLRQYAPQWVYLALDTEMEAEAGEALFGVLLRTPVGEYWNAAHLPVRVANEFLSSDEIAEFSR